MGRPAYVYVIRRGPRSHKVGFSIAPRRRLASLQSGSAVRLSLRRHTPEPLELASTIEAYAHWLLRESQERGEWFAVTEEAAWVAIVAAQEAVEAGHRAPRRINGVGRTLLYPDKIIAPLPPLSLARMEAVLRPGETKTDLIRKAVEAELTRRERIAKRRQSGAVKGE